MQHGPPRKKVGPLDGQGQGAQRFSSGARVAFAPLFNPFLAMNYTQRSFKKLSLTNLRKNLKTSLFFRLPNYDVRNVCLTSPSLDFILYTRTRKCNVYFCIIGFIAAFFIFALKNLTNFECS